MGSESLDAVTGAAEVMQTSINIVPLTWAMFCGSCEAISDAKTDQCPACGAWETLVPLTRLINREITVISRKTA